MIPLHQRRLDPSGICKFSCIQSHHAFSTKLKCVQSNKIKLTLASIGNSFYCKRVVTKINGHRDKRSSNLSNLNMQCKKQNCTN